MHWATPYLRIGVQIGWIGWDWQLDWPGFHGNHPSRYPTQPVERRHSDVYKWPWLRYQWLLPVCFAGTLTWLCRPPRSEPMAAWSPWRSPGQRSHSARSPLELWMRNESRVSATWMKGELLIANWKCNWINFLDIYPLFLWCSFQNPQLYSSCGPDLCIPPPSECVLLAASHDGWLQKEGWFSCFSARAPRETCPGCEVTIQLSLATHDYQSRWLATLAAPLSPQSLSCPKP